MQSDPEEVQEPLVEVANCNYLHEAHFLVSVLDGHGIEAFLPDEHTIGVDPLLVAALGGVRVLVNDSDAERAREILANVGGPSELPGEPGEPGERGEH